MMADEPPASNLEDVKQVAIKDQSIQAVFPAFEPEKVCATERIFATYLCSLLSPLHNPRHRRLTGESLADPPAACTTHLCPATKFRRCQFCQSTKACTSTRCVIRPSASVFFGSPGCFRLLFRRAATAASLTANTVSLLLWERWIPTRTPTPAACAVQAVASCVRR
jgi:hypothetical protein